MLKFPYGIADFQAIIRDDYVYIDRTSYFHDLEDLGRHLLFVRPRRFGKSLWLQTLASYYDLRTAEAHEELFGGLAAGQSPTPNAHRYFVLQWDFSWVTSRGSTDEIAKSLNDYVNAKIASFLVEYRDHLPRISPHDDARYTFLALLTAIRQTSHPLYLLIDEYDNFANELMARDKSVYSDLVHGTGALKELMKTVKGATQGQGLERIFATGVSPVVLSDLSSGMNILTDLSQEQDLNGLCGFKDDEIVDILEQIHSEEAPWSMDETRATIRDWYNGYRFSPARFSPASSSPASSSPASFSPETEGRVYNPTMALHFLRHLQRYQTPPRQLLDSNLAADKDKLQFLLGGTKGGQQSIGRIAAGQQTVLNVLQKDEPVEIFALADGFTLDDMLEQSIYDQTFLASFLTYFGMLTIDEVTDRVLRLRPPNLVVRKLYVEQVLRFLLPEGVDRDAAWKHAQNVLLYGDVEPLAAFVEEKLFSVMSNRDYIFMNEHGLKMVFMTLLWNENVHLMFSEPELSRGYADLCLLRRPDRQVDEVHDLLFEFKFAKPGELGKTGVELREMQRSDLEALDLVQDLFAEAESQLRRYQKALEQRRGEKLQLRAYAVVGLGFERLLVKPCGPLH